MNKPVVFDLSQITPTLLPEELRKAAKQALEFAVDPLNPLDNNPFIGREWLVVSTQLHAAASALELHFDRIFLEDTE